jgi:hypothetical protein
MTGRRSIEDRIKKSGIREDNRQGERETWKKKINKIIRNGRKDEMLKAKAGGILRVADSFKR